MHTTDRILDEILAGLRARRQRNKRTANTGDVNHDDSNGIQDAISSESAAATPSGSEQVGGFEEVDDSSDLLEDLFLKLKSVEGAIRSGGRKDNAIVNYIEITWAGRCIVDAQL